MKKGIEKGIRQGIKAGLGEDLQQELKTLISTCWELDVSFDKTAARVKKNFSLGDEETKKNMQLNW